MTISEAILIIYLNVVPVGLIAMGCVLMYVLVLYEHQRQND
jgi:hypothetical protein